MGELLRARLRNGDPPVPRHARPRSRLPELDKALAVSGRATKILGAVGHAAGLAGQPEKAREVLAELEQLSRARYVSSYAVALVHIGLAEYEHALASLDRACDERAGYLVYLNVDPAVDPIRADPRFAELLRRTKRP